MSYACPWLISVVALAKLQSFHTFHSSSPHLQALAMAVVALAGYGLVNSNLQLLIQIGEWGTA